MDKDWMDFEDLNFEYINSGNTAGGRGTGSGKGRRRESDAADRYRDIGNNEVRQRENRSNGSKRHAGRLEHGRSRQWEDRTADNRLLKEQKRKKRKRKRIVTTTVISILAVGLTIVIFMSVLRIRTLRAFSGEYTRAVDITDVVVSGAALWLKDVEGADVSTEWVEERTEPLMLMMTLAFDPSGIKSGSFSEEPVNESYTECSEKAYKLVADCLRELIVKRLTLVGYADSVSNEEADALIVEALGMPLDDYIKNAGIKIMPDYSELEEELKRAGDYRIEKMNIEWTRDGRESTDEFRTTGDTLIIVDAGYIYERK